MRPGHLRSVREWLAQESRGLTIASQLDAERETEPRIITGRREHAQGARLLVFGIEEVDAVRLRRTSCGDHIHRDRMASALQQLHLPNIKAEVQRNQGAAVCQRIRLPKDTRFT